MKKRQVDHVLRAAGRITGENQFIIIGSQSLHGKYPDLPDDIFMSAEVDLFARRNPVRTDLLNVIGQDSPFHENFGYYADPVDISTATLPEGWQSRLIKLPPGDTEGVSGLCLDPHDLAIAKYVASREKDRVFTTELVCRDIVSKERLIELIELTPIDDSIRDRVRSSVTKDFDLAAKESRAHGQSGGHPDAYDGIERMQARGRENWLKLREQMREQDAMRRERDRALEEERRKEQEHQQNLNKAADKGADDDLSR